MSIIETAYARYSKERFPLPTVGQVLALEERIKVEFLPDYRNFLLKYNGGFFIEPEITPVGEG